MRDVFLFALDSVLANRRRMWLTVAIIAVGVASLVGIQTAVSILAEEVAGSLGRAGAGRFTLQSRDEAPPITLRQAQQFMDFSFMPGSTLPVMPGSTLPVMPGSTGHLDAPLRSDRPFPSQKNARSTDDHPLRFASAWSVQTTMAQVRCGGVATDPVVRVVACDENYLSVCDVRLTAGRGFTAREVEGHQPVALVGDNVRKKLFGAGSGLGEMVSFSGGRYRVVGVLVREGALYGSSLDGSVLIPISETPAGCSITVRVSDAGSLSSAVAAAGRQLAAVRRLPPGVEPDFDIVQSDGTESTLAMLRSKLSLVALAIGLITMWGASVGLMNSLLVSVKQRTREIGTRRALGAKARSIARQFLMESMIIGQLGNLAGVLLGLLFGVLTALALDGHFSIPWPWVGAATLLSLVVSLLSGLIPARRAAALDPIEALRAL